MILLRVWARTLARSSAPKTVLMAELLELLDLRPALRAELRPRGQGGAAGGAELMLSRRGDGRCRFGRGGRGRGRCRTGRRGLQFRRDLVGVEDDAGRLAAGDPEGRVEV